MAASTAHIATARIKTANGRRYMTQLCKHWAHKFEVVHDENQGLVPFSPDRRCRMAADGEGLTLTIEVEDAAVTCARARALGYRVTREAGPMQHGRSVIAFLEDPDGYKVELIQKGTQFD